MQMQRGFANNTGVHAPVYQSGGYNPAMRQSAANHPPLALSDANASQLLSKASVADSDAVARLFADGERQQQQSVGIGMGMGMGSRTASTATAQNSRIFSASANSSRSDNSTHSAGQVQQVQSVQHFHTHDLVASATMTRREPSTLQNKASIMNTNTGSVNLQGQYGTMQPQPQQQQFSATGGRGSGTKRGRPSSLDHLEDDSSPSPAFEDGNNGNLVLEEHAAPWPVAGTPLHQAQLTKEEYLERVETLVDEYYLAGDYDALKEQIQLLRCPNSGDLLVKHIFRASLDQPLLLAVDNQYKVAFTSSLPSSPLSAHASPKNGRATRQQNVHGMPYDRQRYTESPSSGAGQAQGQGQSASVNGSPSAYFNFNSNALLHYDVDGGSFAYLNATPGTQRQVQDQLAQQMQRGGAGDAHADKTESLLVRLAKDGVVNAAEMVRGLYSHVVNMSDLELDVPQAAAHLLAQLELLVQAGVLEPWIFCRLPETVLSTGVTARRREAEENRLKDQGYSPMGSPVAASADPFRDEKVMLTRQISANDGYLGEGFKLLQEVLRELRLFKKVAGRALREYFCTELAIGRAPAPHKGDAFAAFDATMRELNLPNYHHEVVKMAFSLALDLGRPGPGGATGRTLLRLLKHCTAQNLLEDSDVQHGLAIVLGRLDDLVLDAPGAKRTAVELLSSCVSEELLS